MPSVYEGVVHQVRECASACVAVRARVLADTDEAGIDAIPSQRGRKEETELGGTALAAPTLRSGYAERACV